VKKKKQSMMLLKQFVRMKKKDIKASGPLAREAEDDDAIRNRPEDGVAEDLSPSMPCMRCECEAVRWCTWKSRNAAGDEASANTAQVHLQVDDDFRHKRKVTRIAGPRCLQKEQGSCKVVRAGGPQTPRR